MTHCITIKIVTSDTKLNISVLENQWATVKQSVKMDAQSTNLWSEFVGFTDCMGNKLHQHVQYASGEKKIQEYAENECALLEKQAKVVVKYHSFYAPNKDLLTLHTPILNQSILMATATPPVVMDLSTDEELEYRFPPQWAVWTQFGERCSVKMKKLKHTHAFQVMFNGNFD